MNGFAGKRIDLEQGKQSILLTKRTVRFKKTVYLTRNITSFSDGEVEIGSIPWLVIVAVVVLSPLIGLVNGAISGLLLMLAVGGVVWNFAKPKHYGLLLTLNSGGERLFVTSDRRGLSQVVDKISEIIENDKDISYEISISDSQITGNLIQGDTSGNVYMENRYE